MRIVRVEEVLRTSFRFDGSPPTDRDINVNCPSCGSWQVLADCTIHVDREGATAYGCRAGCRTLVRVTLPPPMPFAERGRRLGRHTVHNTGDLTFMGVLLPASEPVVAPRAQLAG